MNIDTLRDIVNVLQMAVTIVCVVLVVRGIREHPKPLLTLFFALDLACLLFSDLYWIVHTWMGRGVYAPFSAMDVGTCGVYLLSAAALDTVFRENAKGIRKVMIAAVVFGVANAALWMAWSGSVFRHIVGGTAFVFFICSVARGLKCADTLSPREWAIFAVACGATVAVNIILLYLSGKAYFVMNLVNSAILFGGLAFFLVRTIQTLRRGNADTALAFSFGALTWNFITAYLSEEPYYTVADFLVILSIILEYMAVRRKAAEK